jgi:ParB-like chromosome segregation protein Spo0J
MLITQLDPRSLTPYATNSKKHPKEQIDKIAKQIHAVGFTQPVIVDADHTIVVGHGRTLAAIELGLETIPCIVRSDLSQDQIKALRIADNKVAESEWDFDNLKFDLGSLARIEFDLSLTGFDDTEIQRMLAETMPIEEKQEEEAASKLMLEVTFANKEDLDNVYQDLIASGYIVKIK